MKNRLLLHQQNKECECSKLMDFFYVNGKVTDFIVHIGSNGISNFTFQVQQEKKKTEETKVEFVGIENKR